jgi:hypothetical protein
MINMDCDDINKFINLYSSQKQILYNHQRDLFDKFVDEIIPNFLTNDSNIFQESLNENKIIKYKFNFDNIKIHVIDEINEINKIDEPMTKVYVCFEGAEKKQPRHKRPPSIGIQLLAVV